MSDPARPLHEIALGGIGTMEPKDWMTVYVPLLVASSKKGLDAQADLLNATRRVVAGRLLAASIFEALTDFTRSTGYALSGKAPGVTGARWGASMRLSRDVGEAAEKYANSDGTQRAALEAIARRCVPDELMKKIQEAEIPEEVDDETRQAASAIRKLQASPFFKLDDEGEAS